MSVRLRQRSTNRVSPRGSFARWSWPLVVAVLATCAWACDTPVYRYAMYRWQATPYELYLLHRGELNDQQLAVQAAVEQQADAERRSNLAFLPVNLNDDPELTNVPPDVKRAWEAGGKAVDQYLLVNPRGIPVHQGALDTAAFKALLDSPARRELAEQLAAGKLGTLIVLLPAETSPETPAGKDGEPPSPTAAKDAPLPVGEAQPAASDPPAAPTGPEVLALVKQLVADFHDGKIPLYASSNEALPGEKSKKPAQNQEVGLVVVRRDDPAERWFVESLLSVEPDLRETQYTSDPMVFVAYGRGRALPPFLGRGISRANLQRDIEFISGACSCTVKEQNPGVDLLVQNDWEKAAELLAERFGAEEGNETQLGGEQLFPNLIIPQAEPDAAEQANSTGPAHSASVPDNTASGSVAAEGAPAEGTGKAAGGDGGTRQVAARDVSPTAEPTDTDHADTDHADTEPAEPALDFIWWVGGGVAVAVLMLLGATFVLLRPR